MDFESFLKATECDSGGDGIVVTHDNYGDETHHDIFKILDLSVSHEEWFGIIFQWDVPRNDVMLGIHMGHRYNDINCDLPDFPILSYNLPLGSTPPINGSFMVQPHTKQVIRWWFGMWTRDSYRVRDRQFTTIQHKTDFTTILTQIVQELINHGYDLYRWSLLQSFIPKYFQGMEMVRVQDTAARTFEQVAWYGRFYAYILYKRIELSDIINWTAGVFGLQTPFPNSAEWLLDILKQQRTNK